MSYPSPLGHLLRSLHLTVACGSVPYGPYGVTEENGKGTVERTETDGEMGKGPACGNFAPRSYCLTLLSSSPPYGRVPRVPLVTRPTGRSPA